MEVGKSPRWRGDVCSKCLNFVDNVLIPQFFYGRKHSAYVFHGRVVLKVMRAAKNKPVVL